MNARLLAVCHLFSKAHIPHAPVALSSQVLAGLPFGITTTIMSGARNGLGDS